MNTGLSIDLNCDLGEGSPHDAELMPLISSANIACGAHAGDEATMRRTVALALQHGVAIGAHPGFDDRENFGRRELKLSSDEVYELVTRQVLALRAIVHELGGRLAHVKPHGALYHQAASDPFLAQAIAEAVQDIDREVIVYGLYDSALTGVADAIGLHTIGEAFADRTYQANGELTPRSQANALITDAETACRQALDIVRTGRIRATDGSEIFLKARTLCLHGDGPHAVAFAQSLRQGLLQAGIEIAAPEIEDDH